MACWWRTVFAINCCDPGNSRDLARISALVASGRIRPGDLPEGFQWFGLGQSLGQAVLLICSGIFFFLSPQE